MTEPKCADCQHAAYSKALEGYRCMNPEAGSQYGYRATWVRAVAAPCENGKLFKKREGV